MKRRQIVLYIVVMLFLLTTSVYATINTSLDVRYKVNGQIAAGSEFEVTLYLKDLQTDKNIKAVEGWINYDKNILEPITLDSVVTGEDGKVKLDENNNLPVSDGSKDTTDLNKGIILNCNPEANVKKGDCRLVVNFDTPINKETDLITLKFKLKGDVEPGSYKEAIKYSLFTVFADDTQESKSLGDFSIEVIVSQKSGSSNNTVNNTADNRTNNETTNNAVENKAKNETGGTSNNVVTNESNKTKNETKPVNNSANQNNNNNGGGTQSPTSNKAGKDNTVSPTNLPKTGYKYIIIPIVMIAVIGLVFYRKYSKYNKFDNK